MNIKVSEWYFQTDFACFRFGVYTSCTRGFVCFFFVGFLSVKKTTDWDGRRALRYLYMRNMLSAELRRQAVLLAQTSVSFPVSNKDISWQQREIRLTPSDNRSEMSGVSSDNKENSLFTVGRWRMIVSRKIESDFCDLNIEYFTPHRLDRYNSVTSLLKENGIILMLWSNRSPIPFQFVHDLNSFCYGPF